MNFYAFEIITSWIVLMLGSSRSRFWIKYLNTNIYYGGDSKRGWGNIGIWSRERAQDNKLILSTSLSLWATEVLTWSGTLKDCRFYLRDGSAEGWGSWTILPSHQSSVESFSKEHKDSGIPHLTCTCVKTVIRKPLGDESWVCALGHFCYVLDSYMTRIYVQGTDGVH